MSTSTDQTALDMASTIAEDAVAGDASDFVEITFVVEPNYVGWRLDRYLCEKIRRLSRARVQRIIENSLIADRKMKPSTLVTRGMTFKLRRRAEDEPETPLEIPELFRDDWLLVFDKPAGLPIHPTARYHKGTLVSRIKDKYGADFQADPAHRLDRETSGILVCGRTTESCRRLMRLFQSQEVHKEYLAICEGAPKDDTFEVDAPIAEGGPVVRIGVRIDREVGRPARTRFKVLARFERDGEAFSLVRAYPETGRQHQIRIHLREAGHPIVGDKIYGPDENIFDRFSKHQLTDEDRKRMRIERHALHAATIQFPHPDNGEPLRIDAPLPEDLRAFLPAATVAACIPTKR